MSSPSGFTLLEMAIALALIAVLLSILLPALSSARITSQKEQCAANLAHIGQAWQTWLDDHDKQFPFVPVQPAWQYGGVRFSAIDGTAFPDNNRPLTPYLHLHKTRNVDDLCVCCPADRGISTPAAAAATAGRTAINTYGTSYRANAPLLDVRLSGQSDELRGMARREVNIFASRLVLCGDPVWYEASEETGRDATWHAAPNAGNLLFLDGHVAFATIRPKHVVRSILFDPIVQPAASSPESLRSTDR
jgi:prepilin-type N-terminal cleavage/methylation domain-containing protein/prepilin-type processing-associated H-X9-DG protein